MQIKIGDLVKYTDEEEGLGIGVVTEKREHGGYWAYFVEVDDWYPVTASLSWEVICK